MFFICTNTVDMNVLVQLSLAYRLRLTINTCMHLCLCVAQQNPSWQEITNVLGYYAYATSCSPDKLNI